MKLLYQSLLLILTVLSAATAWQSAASPSDSASAVIRDGGVTISRAEFTEILRTAAPRVVEQATIDMGDRLEFINSIMASRRLAAEADTFSEEDDGYWELYFALLTAKREFVFKKLMDDLQLPDFAPLAEERYQTKKDKYALVPEKRASSHILLASPPGRDRENVREQAARILAELRDGADWDSMVAERSDDPSSKSRNGALNRWVTLGDPGITPPYTEALFEIDEIGGYSRVTDTQFGVHIIRLDGIEESYYRPYEEVSETIVDDIEREFRQRAARVTRARYNLTDEAYIDGEAMDELFAPYTAQ